MRIAGGFWMLNGGGWPMLNGGGFGANIHFNEANLLSFHFPLYQTPTGCES